MRSEIREMRARQHRIQFGVIIAGAIVAALVVLLFDALVGL